MSQSSRISSLNRTLQETESWLRELAERPPFQSEEQAYALFRAVLHSLRDRLEMHEAVHFAAQMPTLVRGIYYEGWRPSLAPNDEHTVDEFLASVRESLGPGQPADAVDLHAGTRAVLEFLRDAMDEGQIRHVRLQLPAPLQTLWPADGGAPEAPAGSPAAARRSADRARAGRG